VACAWCGSAAGLPASHPRLGGSAQVSSSGMGLRV
jgi:hypothetical protein